MKKAVKERYQKLIDLGCIVCHNEKGIYTPPEIHHPYGRTKDGDFHTYPLCFWHHREGSDCDDYTSRHPHKGRFEDRHGTDEYLLNITNELIK